MNESLNMVVVSERQLLSQDCFTTLKSGWMVASEGHSWKLRSLPGEQAFTQRLGGAPFWG